MSQPEDDIEKHNVLWKDATEFEMYSQLRLVYQFKFLWSAKMQVDSLPYKIIQFTIYLRSYFKYTDSFK